jgi:hypothetical protein
MKCDGCEQMLGECWWLFCVNTERTIWPAQAGSEIPELEVSSSRVLGEYCSYPCARDAAEKYLSTAGAKATWSDVRPIEECAVCGADVDTSKDHTALSLEEAEGLIDAPEPTGNVRYPARFCSQCVNGGGIK